MNDDAGAYDIRTSSFSSSSSSSHAMRIGGVVGRKTSVIEDPLESSSFVQNNQNNHIIETADDGTKSESGPGAPANSGRRPESAAESVTEGLRTELNISRTKTSPLPLPLPPLPSLEERDEAEQHQQRLEIAKALQPTHRKADSLSIGMIDKKLVSSIDSSVNRPLKPTLNLPPIRLASVSKDRASSPSPSPSSSSSCPSPSLLPRTSEPHPPSVHGRVSYPSSLGPSSPAATDNTTIFPTTTPDNAKRCPSLSPPRPSSHSPSSSPSPSPSPQSQSQSQSPSPSCSASLPSISSSPHLKAAVAAPPSLPSLLPDSDVIPAGSTLSVPLSSDRIGVDGAKTDFDSRRLAPLAHPLVTADLDHSRTSRKRTIDEHQGGSPTNSSNSLFQSSCTNPIPNISALPPNSEVSLITQDQIPPIQSSNSSQEGKGSISRVWRVVIS
ncbi:hypothetical protein AA313_de0205678 [Arthrobotrys entomopaga]|nr:hypothetical protein AA313_de0205678 [Arthrobotrys entomopaga]